MRERSFEVNQDLKFGESSNFGFNQNVNSMSASATNQLTPKDTGVGNILTTLHLEWSKHEKEKNLWLAEKAEYEAKISILEGRIQSFTSINADLVSRIKMLESSILHIRSQKRFGDESIVEDKLNAYQPPKYLYTPEQTKKGRHLLQQYLKEFNMIDECIKSQGITNEKVAELLKKNDTGLFTDTQLNSKIDFTAGSISKNKKMTMNEERNSLDIIKQSYVAVSKERNALRGRGDSSSYINMGYSPRKQSVNDLKGDEYGSVSHMFDMLKTDETDKPLFANVDKESLSTTDSLKVFARKSSSQIKIAPNIPLPDTNIAKIETKPNNNSFFSSSPLNKTNENMDNYFESKLSNLAKTFNVHDSTSSNVSVSSLSSVLDHDKNVEAKKEEKPRKSDPTDLDLGILSEIDMFSENLEETAQNKQSETSESQKQWAMKTVCKGHMDSITSVCFNPINKFAASASYDGVVCIWDFTDYKNGDVTPLRYLRGHECPILFSRYHNSGDCLFTSDKDGNIFVWNATDDYNRIQSYKVLNEAVWHLDHNQACNVLLSASANGKCHFWKPDSMEPVSEFTVYCDKESGSGLLSAHFLPVDSSKVVCSAGNTISMYDTILEKNIFSLKIDKYISSKSPASGLIQSSDIHNESQSYVTGWGHNEVKYVDLRLGKFTESFVAHVSEVTSVAFGSHGTHLVTGGADGSCRMWNSKNSCYQDISAHRVKNRTGLNCVSFHREETFMLTGGADEIVKLYI